MQEFPANSAKAKARSEEPKPSARPEKIERVTSAEPVRRRRGLGRQFKETFIGGSARMAFEYMLTDVVIPAVQDTMLDALQGGLERLIKGESRGPRRSMPSSYANANAPHIAYNRVNVPIQSRSSSRMLSSRRSQTGHDFADLVIPSLVEAEQVIDQMYDILSRYEAVTVADLYAMTGVKSSHIDHKWGWTQLRGAKATRMRNGGFRLDLPEPEPLD